MTENQKQIECAICHNPIPEGPGGWMEGNNAEPVVKGGRCCTACNWTVVIPARVARLNRGEGPY